VAEYWSSAGIALFQHSFGIRPAARSSLDEIVIDVRIYFVTAYFRETKGSL